MKRESKSEKRKQAIISVVIVLIMVLSVLGIMVNRGSDSNNFKYSFNNKSIEFGKYYNRYYLDFESGRVFFYNLPDQIQVNLSLDTSDKIRDSQMLYLTIDPNDSPQNLAYIDVARLELSDEFFKNNRYLISGKTFNSSNYQNLPILDCVNATAYIPVIKFIGSNTTEIILEDNCIIMKGRNLDFIKYRDLILYKFYGVY